MASPTIDLSDLALIDLAYYLRHIDKDQSNVTAGEADQITQAINRTSSEAENYCQRPFRTDSDIDQPTDKYGDEIEKYAAYASLALVPDDLKGAIADLVQYRLFMQRHRGTRQSTHGEKSHVFVPDKPVDAIYLLDRVYRYYPYQQSEYLTSTTSAGYFGWVLN